MKKRKLCPPIVIIYFGARKVAMVLHLTFSVNRTGSPIDNFSCFLRKAVLEVTTPRRVCADFESLHVFGKFQEI